MSVLKTYWVYILRCKNNTYYTGYTNDLAKRFLSHLDGTGKCKYTRSFKPLCIAQSWEIKESKALAMQIERYIKTLSRPEKEKIIACPVLIFSLFGKEKEAWLSLGSCIIGCNPTLMISRL